MNILLPENEVIGNSDLRRSISLYVYHGFHEEANFKTFVADS